jgi:hypothetical protein
MRSIDVLVSSVPLLVSVVSPPHSLAIEINLTEIHPLRRGVRTPTIADSISPTTTQSYLYQVDSQVFEDLLFG